MDDISQSLNRLSMKQLLQLERQLTSWAKTAKRKCTAKRKRAHCLQANGPTMEPPSKKSKIQTVPTEKKYQNEREKRKRLSVANSLSAIQQERMELEEIKLKIHSSSKASIVASLRLDQAELEQRLRHRTRHHNKRRSGSYRADKNTSNARPCYTGKLGLKKKTRKESLWKRLVLKQHYLATEKLAQFACNVS